MISELSYEPSSTKQRLRYPFLGRLAAKSRRQESMRMVLTPHSQGCRDARRIRLTYPSYNRILENMISPESEYTVYNIQSTNGKDPNEGACGPTSCLVSEYKG